MAVVCNIREFIISPVSGQPNTYYYWDKVDKVVRTAVYLSIDDFYELDAGSFIDVYQSGSQIIGVFKTSGYTNINFQVSKPTLTSPMGETNLTLISAVLEDGFVTITYQALSGTYTQVVPMQTMTSGSPAVEIEPCFNNFYNTPGTVLNQWCDGFTLNRVIVNNEGGTDLVQTANSPTCGYSPPILESFRITEEITIDYRDKCFNKPICFVWKNTLGGWDYWVFEAGYVRTLNTESKGIFNKNYTRISDINNPITERGKIAANSMVFGEVDLTEDQKDGLEQILKSNKVYILNQDGSVNREVKVSSGSATPSNSKHYKFSFEFEIEDVPINTISN